MLKGMSSMANWRPNAYKTQFKGLLLNLQWKIQRYRFICKFAGGLSQHNVCFSFFLVTVGSKYIKINKEKRTTKTGAPGNALRLYSKRNVGLKQTRKRGRRRQGSLGVSWGWGWGKEKRGGETNKEKRTTKAGVPGSALRLNSKRNVGLKQTRKRGRQRWGPLEVSWGCIQIETWG